MALSSFHKEQHAYTVELLVACPCTRHAICHSGEERVGCAGSGVYVCIARLLRKRWSGLLLTCEDRLAVLSRRTAVFAQIDQTRVWYAMRRYDHVSVRLTECNKRIYCGWEILVCICYILLIL